MAGHAAAQRGQVFLDYFDQLGTVRWLCGNAMSVNATTIARFFGCDKRRDIVSLAITPAAEKPKPTLPADLHKAPAAPKARKLWSDITPIARRDWIQWITSAKQPETRTRRIKNACSMLAGGKRRVCCFDRSGLYSKSLSAPKAAT
jgi:hypothetical protein